jgi:hypothetical protein
MNPVLGWISDQSVGITGVCLGIGIAVALIGTVALSRRVIRTATVS